MTPAGGMNPIRDPVAAFILNAVGSDVDDNDDIFQLGLVSSMFAVELVDFIEVTFQITVDNDDLELGNFRSVSAMSKFVAAKLAVLGR
jgi:methoxymalonate biosynthesis acyl carrier protein